MVLELERVSSTDARMFFLFSEICLSALKLRSHVTNPAAQNLSHIYREKFEVWQVSQLQPDFYEMCENLSFY